MKSAYEIALSKLEEATPTVHLTDEQKARLADVDSLYRSKIAEKRLLLEDEMRKLGENSVEQELLQRQLKSEVARLEEECETKKELVRQEG